MWFLTALIPDAVPGPGAGQRGGEAHHGGHQDRPVDRAAGDQDDDNDDDHDDKDDNDDDDAELPPADLVAAAADLHLGGGDQPRGHARQLQAVAHLQPLARLPHLAAAGTPRVTRVLPF